jgi:hypothetical protein
MQEERKFSLIVWEQTEECKKEFEEAKKRLEHLSKEWKEKYVGDSYIGRVQFDASGYPEFWINDFGSFHTGRFYGQKKNWSPQEALQSALRWGDDGWWHLDDLEKLINGEGPLLEEAMFDCGFRRHKKDPNQWARVKKNDEDPYKKRWEERFGKEYKEISKEELERLTQLRVLPNESAGLDRTYSLMVGKRGMIYASLMVNPFGATRTEDLPRFAELLSNRGHIAKNQNGFQIDASNVKLQEQEGIYIKAIKPSQSYIECVWPTTIPQPKIYDLADDLASRVSMIK